MSHSSPLYHPSLSVIPPSSLPLFVSFCPLWWSLVSIMVPKMHCGFVGAVRRKGMHVCDWVCEGSEKWCGHFDTWEVFHQQLEGEQTTSKALTHSPIREKPLKLRKFTDYALYIRVGKCSVFFCIRIHQNGNFFLTVVVLNIGRVQCL